MNTTHQLDLMKHALRNQVCVECAATDIPVAESTPSSTECEGACPLFANLPRLARVVRDGQPPCGYHIFAKSLQPFPIHKQGPDLVYALSLLETVVVSSSTDECADPGGCKRLGRMAAEIACQDKHHDNSQ